MFSQWFICEEDKTVYYANSSDKMKRALDKGYKKITGEYAMYLIDACHFDYETM